MLCLSPNISTEGLQTDILIAVEVGPEVIAGSTRLKSGTAQKNGLQHDHHRGAMIRLGKVWQNVMVDLQLTNQKLHERARRILMTYGGVSYDEAVSLLQQTNGHVKTALLMALGKFSEAEARLQLKRANDLSGKP